MVAGEELFEDKKSVSSINKTSIEKSEVTLLYKNSFEIPYKYGKDVELIKQPKYYKMYNNSKPHNTSSGYKSNVMKKNKAETLFFNKFRTNLTSFKLNSNGYLD